MSRKTTRRQIAKLRADAKRRERTSFKWFPAWWRAGALGLWTALCMVSFMAATLGVVYAPSVNGYDWIATLVWPIWFAAPILLDRATRSLLGRYLVGKNFTAYFNFYKLWENAQGKGPKSARRELRKLCEEGTLKILTCQAKSVKLGQTEAWVALNRIYGQAKELSDAIIEFEQNKPEDPKVVEARLRQKLRDEARQIERDRVAQQAIAQLREENELAERAAQLGITSTAQDVIDELRGATAGNQEIAAMQQPI